MPVSRLFLGLEIVLWSSLLMTYCFAFLRLCSNQHGNVTSTIAGNRYFIFLLIVKQKNLLCSIRSSLPVPRNLLDCGGAPLGVECVSSLTDLLGLLGKVPVKSL